MIKFRNILLESLSGIDYSVGIKEKKIFKVLQKSNITGDELQDAVNLMKDKIGIPSGDAAKIAILYKNNYRPDGDYDNVKDTQWVIPSEESLDFEQMALGDYFDITPFVFKPFNGVNNTYVPIVNVSDKFRNKRGIDNILIIPKDVIVEEAYEKILEGIDEEGYEFFSTSQLESHIVLNDNVAMYNAKEIAEEEWNGYLNRKESLKLDTKEYMIENLGLLDEYYDLKEQVEEYTKDIEGLNKEREFGENKADRLYKDIRIITMEIEKLSDTIDYGDDEEEYYSMYDEDISDLNDKLNKYESIYEEVQHILNDIQTDLNNKEKMLEDVYEDYEIYNNDEKFKELFIERRVEFIFQDMEDDITSYIWDSGLTIAEAIREGIVYIEDDDEIIRDAIDRDGPLSFLNYGGTYIDEFGYGDEYFYIIMDPYS